MRGLILCIAVLFCLGSAGCKPKVDAGDAANTPIARAGPETWSVEGKPVQIEATYYLDLPYGVQYTIHYPWAFGSGKITMTEQEALAVALPVMEYAYQKGSYRRFAVTKNGAPVETSRIGVVLIEHQATGDRGFKVSQALLEIQARLAAEGGRPEAR